MIMDTVAGRCGRGVRKYTYRQTKGGRRTATHLAIVLLCWAALQSLGCQRMLDQAARRMLPREGVRPAVFAVHTQRRVGFTTADGVALRADVHRPIGIVKAPTLLVRIPFTNTVDSTSKCTFCGG
jgi:predicted acyl esterase